MERTTITGYIGIDLCPNGKHFKKVLKGLAERGFTFVRTRKGTSEHEEISAKKIPEKEDDYTYHAHLDIGPDTRVVALISYILENKYCDGGCISSYKCCGECI